MTGEAEWEERNNAYLAAGLAWLRARLAGSEAGEPAGPEQAPWPDGSAAAEPEPGPALELLSDRFAMSPFERSILLLCAAAEFDPGIAAAWAGAEPGAGRPTFGLALSVLPEPTWDALSPHRPLRYWRQIGRASCRERV